MARYIDVPFLANGDTFITADNRIFRVKELAEYEGVEIILYKNSAESNRVDKTNYLEEAGKIYGIFRDSFSITEPAFELEYNQVPNFNYVYITQLNRYYYVNDITSVANNLWLINLNIDVLMTYKTEILELDCFVDRNEFTFNNYIIDDKVVIETGYDIELNDITLPAMYDTSNGIYRTYNQRLYNDTLNSIGMLTHQEYYGKMPFCYVITGRGFGAIYGNGRTDIDAPT